MGGGESFVSRSFRCLTVVYGYHLRVFFLSREIVWLTIMTDQRAIFNITVTPIMQLAVFSRYIVQNSQA